MYHGVSGKLESKDAFKGATADTLLPKPWSDDFEKIEVTNVNPLKINGVKVVLTDVLATNGVVHAIEDVLIPEGFELPGAPSPSP